MQKIFRLSNYTYPNSKKIKSAQNGLKRDKKWLKGLKSEKKNKFCKSPLQRDPESGSVLMVRSQGQVSGSGLRVRSQGQVPGSGLRVRVPNRFF